MVLYTPKKYMAYKRQGTWEIIKSGILQRKMK